MRSEKEMYELILSVAEKDERVRIVGMNGSRTNPNVPKDDFQDYDIVYVVTDMQSFLDHPSWIDIFGQRVILQMPEAMDLYPPELGNWFSYLMLFEDETRIDLILVPIEELNKYLQNDKLIKILLDKDHRVPVLPPSTDKDYWVQRPTAAYFDDCCNEFWWLSTYVVKGLCRDELPYAIDHLTNMRNQLYTMLSWQVGIEIDFSASMGKNYKYIKNYLSINVWKDVMKTYRNDTKGNIWSSFWKCCELFRNASTGVALQMEFKYPEYDEKVTRYLEEKNEK